MNEPGKAVWREPHVPHKGRASSLPLTPTPLPLVKYKNLLSLLIAGNIKS